MVCLRAFVYTRGLSSGVFVYVFFSLSFCLFCRVRPIVLFSIFVVMSHVMLFVESCPCSESCHALCRVMSTLFQASFRA